MKKTVLLLVLGVASLSLSAQSRMTYSWEFIAGVGVGKGPQFSFTPEFIAQYDLGGGFSIGAGTGVRYARPCKVYSSKHGRGFHDEMDIPVFLRLGFGKAQFFANVDAGYAIGVLGYPGPEYVPGAKKDFPYDGLFFEPHIGLKVGRHGALALGLLLQQSTINIHEIKGTTIDGENMDALYSSMSNAFTPAITLRYVVGF